VPAHTAHHIWAASATSGTSTAPRSSSPDFGFGIWDLGLEENHPVSRSGCHPSFERRGAIWIWDLGFGIWDFGLRCQRGRNPTGREGDSCFWIWDLGLGLEENHPVSRSGGHPSFGRRGAVLIWDLRFRIWDCVAVATIRI
jgi:hypothetical protein